MTRAVLGALGAAVLLGLASLEATARAMANARTKSSVRPLSGVRTAAPKPVVLDAFEELEALLDPPPAKGVSRRPGD